MKGFVTQEMLELRAMSQEERAGIEQRFTGACQAALGSLGSRPFHVRGRLNVAALDGVLSALMIVGEDARSDLQEAYADLLADEDFLYTIYFDTSDSDVVKSRVPWVVEAFTA